MSFTDIQPPILSTATYTPAPYRWADAVFEGLSDCARNAVQEANDHFADLRAPDRARCGAIDIVDGMFKKLYTVDNTIIERGRAITVIPYQEAWETSEEWAARAYAIRVDCRSEITDKFMVQRVGILADFMEQLDGLVWLETAGELNVPTREVKKYRNELAAPVVSEANDLLQKIDEAIQDPLMDVSESLYTRSGAEIQELWTRWRQLV